MRSGSRGRAVGKGASAPTVERFMEQALGEARKGLGLTSPNPPVGAVVVDRRGRRVGLGHHQRAGGPHAEIVALRRAGAEARGGDIYTTLEPCNHHGRTPPCTEAIVRAGIRRVFVGSRDPNPEVTGGGVRRLRREGIQVTEGVLLDRCDELNAPFFKHVTTGLPWLTLKMAATLDGKSATRSGEARWISGPQSRRRVHELRSQVDAVLVGAGTALADDPLLTARLGKATRQPARVVLDAEAGLPAHLQVFRDRSAPTLLATWRSPRRLSAPDGVEILQCRASPHGVDLEELMTRLGDRGFLRVLCEGGPTLAGSLLRSGLVDELLVFLAPKLMGEGRTWVEGLEGERVQDALALGKLGVESVGSDLLITCRPANAAVRSSRVRKAG